MLIMLNLNWSIVLCVLCQEEEQPKQKRSASAESEYSGMGDHPAAATSTLKALCKQKHTGSLQNVPRTRFSACTGRESPESSRSHDAGFAAVFVERERGDAAAQEGKVEMAGLE